MKSLLRLALLMLTSALAFAQAGNVPLCDSFNASGQPIESKNGTTNCTDYFGVGNWANSPLPSGSITGFTLIASGSGYTTPEVIIVDPTGSGATATATVDPTTGAITGVTGAGTGYTMPQVTIVDLGPGGTPLAPTCGGNLQPTCGSGALVTAIIGPPFTGGMLKFKDALPDLKGLIAKPDTTTFPGSDFYIIGLTDYAAQMHANLPMTKVRGYVQLNNGTDPKTGLNTIAPPPQSYLGPVIVAQKGRPVRVLFKNMLGTGAGGDLFIPVDTTYMGASDAQNRATLHLHGGATPWISDGTPHQWTTPVGDPLHRGVSTAFVPDMFFDSTGNVFSFPQCSATVTTSCWPNAVPAGYSNDPGAGAMTFFWTNQQGGRLMFYHDHAYGITRLNVYAGEAAGYLLVDPTEEDMLAAGTVPGTLGTKADLNHVIPLVIQDKTFVPSAAQLSMQDPTWVGGGFGTTPGAANEGDLWFPHVYIPNQNPSDPGGGNAFGRWDYGAWFFPPMTTLTAANPPTAVTNACTSSAFPGQTLLSTNACPSCGCPITPNPSGTPEGFMDTPVVNGKAYPVMHVAPEAYRFRILSAGNDRSWNLSWFIADATQGNTEVAMVPAVPPSKGTTIPLCTRLTPITMPGLDMGLTGGLLDPATGNPLNGTGLPVGCWPNYGPSSGIPKPQTMWAADGRFGGVPDPRTAGPAWVQIGTEGGLLPAPVVIPATPANFEYNTRSVTVTNVAAHGLWLGPAERADVIVDFSQFAGQTLILYNDAPAPVPAFDSRVDYFTGDDDQTPIGGAPSTQPGYGPNTRTIMQVIVDGTPSGAPFSLPALKSVFASTATTPGVFAATQPQTIVPEAAYNSAYNKSFPNSYAPISANNLTFTPLAPLTFDSAPCAATPPAICANLDQKAIQELFTLDYGRMNATLGTELPLTSFQVQTTIPLGYVDPPTEIIRQGDTQLWKITHNGVDTHFIHFHLFNVQVINRMGWDGSLRPPDANEIGWKDTVRMNPLEDILVALQPITPQLPWPVPDSIRLFDVTSAPGATGPMFSNIDPLTGNGVTTVNALNNFGWEYVWHCHILGHEENDMMRPITFQVPPPAPANPALRADPWAPGGMAVNLYWTDMSASVAQPGGGFNVKIATDAGFTQNVVAVQLPNTSTTGFGSTLSYPFTPVAGLNATYFYEVQAFTPNGISAWTTGSGPIQPALTATTIAATSPITYGQTSVVTVTVTSPQGVPTGNVLLSVDGASALLLGLPGILPNQAVYNLSGLTAGTHTVTASYPDVTNALITPSSASATIQVNPAALTITGPTVTVNYGDPVPVLTAAFSGFVNGDSAANLTTQPTCTTTYTQGSPVGSYPTTCSGAVDPNYTITYSPGSVTVNGAPLTITASSASVPYGSAIPAVTAAFTGFVNGDTSAVLTAPPVCTTTATLGSAVGTYPTTCSGAAAANYTISYVAGSITITAVPLTITASSAVVSYGAAVPAITPSFGGFVNGESSANLTTQPTCSTTYVPGSGVSGSPYPSTCSGAVDPNYTISYVPGTVTVTAVPLTITASSTSVAYGSPAPAITAAYAGFIPGDTVASLTAPAVCSTTYTLGSPVSNSPYASSCSGAVDPNYTISYVPGTVTVTAVPLTITASSTSVAYGSPAPAITAAYAGFIPGDTVASLTTPAVCSTTYTLGSPVSNSPYASSCSGATSPNYTISYVSGSVTVSAVPLTITASSGAMTYGGVVPVITPAFVGFVNGQNSSVLSAQPVCSTTATATSNLGNYPSSCSGAAAANYTISYVAGTVAVNAAPLTITASSGAMTYGGVVPAITPSFSGFVNGQNSSALSAQPVCSTTATATSNVGTYASSCTGAAAANYTIGYVAGTVTVGKATSITTITAHTPSPSNVGQAVIVSASVSPQFTGVPTGAITINASTGESCAGTVSAGVASCSITFTTAGTRTLTSTYGGDTNFVGSVSAGVTQNVVGLAVTVNPASLTFPDTTLNTNSAILSATLTNTGARLTTLSYSFTDPNYTKATGTNNCGTTLNTNASCTIYVRFRPTTLGAHPATLNINAGTTLASVALSGNGVAPIAVLGTLTPTPLLATRGATAQGTVTLTNSGTGALTIASMTIGGASAAQFSQTNNCGTSLAAGANCTIAVTFRPPLTTARGNKSAILRVRDNTNGVANSLQTTALAGTAQ